MESYLSLPLDNHLTGFEKVERNWARFPRTDFPNLMVVRYALSYGLPFHDEESMGTLVYCSLSEEITIWNDLLDVRNAVEG